MKPGKRALALLMALLLLMCGCITQVDAAPFYEGEAVQTRESKQSQESEKARSGDELEEADSGLDQDIRAEASETSIQERTSRSEETSVQDLSETGATQTEEQSDTLKPQKVEETDGQSLSSETEQGQVRTSRAAAGAYINSPNDPQLVSLVPDENFRKVIYDSLANYTQYDGKKHAEGWLGGNPDDPPETVQEILETYQGPINGAKDFNDPDEEKIRDITGIQYLKIAGTANRSYSIDLSGNLITDLMPVANACNEEEYYYGGYVYCEDYGRYGYRAVVMEFLDNPLRCIPKKLSDSNRKLGFLVFTDLSRGDIQYVEPKDMQFYYLREDTERFEGYLRVGFCQYESMDPDAEYVPITDFDIAGQPTVNKKLLSAKKANSIVGTDVVIEQTDQGPNKDRNVDVKYTNLTKSCELAINVTLDQCMESMSTNFTGIYSTNITSMVYPMLPSFTIFDKVETSGEYSGNVQLKKVDKLTGNAVNGAVFSLYREVESGEDILIQEGLETATRKVRVYNDTTKKYETKTLPGYTEVVKGLEPGTYYFQETKAPEGYQLSREKYSVTVEDVTPYLSGGLKNLDYSSGDGRQIQATAKENETYISWKMGEPVKLHLKNAEGDVAETVTDQLVESVEITYHSLEGSTEAVTETYDSLQKAQEKLNSYIDGNNITGAVEVKVLYDKEADSLTQCVSAGDEPLYTTVAVEKTWVGNKEEDVLPEVTFQLYQSSSENGEKKLVNSHTVPEGTEPEGYSYTFATDSEGKPLPMYYVDAKGDLFQYSYTVEENFKSGAFIQGEAQDPVTEILYETLPGGEKTAVGSKITIPLTNCKALASIKIIKIDANETNRKLSDVAFKLEVQENGQWKEVATGITDERGEVQFEDLDSGEYRVTETKTQDDYILLSKPLMISIGDLTDPDAEREFVYVVENARKFGLPEAGGIGGRWYVWVGIIVLAATGIIQIQRKKLNKKMR